MTDATITGDDLTAPGHEPRGVGGHEHRAAAGHEAREATGHEPRAAAGHEAREAAGHEARETAGHEPGAAAGHEPRARNASRAVARPAWLHVAGAAVGMAIVGSSFAVLDTLRAYPQSGGQAVRYAAGAALLFLMAGRRLPRPTARQGARLALLAATGLAAFNLLVLAAEASMDPGSVGVIVATVPVLLALAGPLQDGRRPERRVVAAAAMVAVGAAAVQGLGGEVTVAGLAAALGALACEAAFSLLAAPLLAPLGPVSTSAWAAILAVPMLLVVGLVADGPGNLLQMPTVEEALGLAWLAVGVTAIAFVLWYSAVHALGVERTGLLTGVLPVSALVVAALLGTADLTAGRLAGAVLVGGGIAAGLMVRPVDPSRAAR